MAYTPMMGSNAAGSHFAAPGTLATIRNGGGLWGLQGRLSDRIRQMQAQQPLPPGVQAPMADPNAAMNASAGMAPVAAPAAQPLAGYTGDSLHVDPSVNPQNIQNSPAYQFRFGEGQRAVMQSAARNGSLLSGGTLKDLQDRGQGLASTEFDNEWNRQFQTGTGNANRTLAGLGALMNTGFNAAGSMGQNDIYGGNAQAGGTIGSASAINQGIGGAANTIGAYLAARRQRQQMPVGISGPINMGGTMATTNEGYL